MKAEGTHVLAEYFSCPYSLIDDTKAVERILKEELSSGGFSMVDIVTKSFDPIGITCIAILEQSHISVHTYPETGHVSLDIFHCSLDVSPCLKVVKGIEKQLQASYSKIYEMHRGPRIGHLNANLITSEARPGFSVQYLIRDVVFEQESKHQMISIIENDAFGRMLFLDGELQLAESDVHLYNRALVDPLRLADQVKRVAILGGGDGGVLREVLKWNVEEVFVVDYDPAVIDASKTYLSKVCANAFEDPRATTIIDDAINYLNQARDLDVIIYDLTLHPSTTTTLSAQEYLTDVLEKAYKALRPGGLWSMQCSADHDVDTRNLLQEVLPHSLTNVCFERSFIPSLCGPWLFASGFNKKQS